MGGHFHRPQPSKSEAIRRDRHACVWRSQAEAIAPLERPALVHPARRSPLSLRSVRGPGQRVRRWQSARTWARLIREAEALWHVDVRDLRRLGAQELGQLVEEVPPSLRSRVNRWLVSLGVCTRLA